MTADMTIKALVPWFGGKRTLADRIVRQLCRANGASPKAFWDLMVGGFPVTFAMPRCSHMTVNDMHGDVINLARILQDPQRWMPLYRRLRRTLAHESIFHDSKDALEGAEAEADMFGAPAAELSDEDRAYHFFVTSWLGRSGVAGTERTNYQPAVRWTSGGGHGGIRFQNAVDSIPAWRRRLRDLIILQRDVFEIIAKIEDQDGTSIYADPPYVRAGARSGSCKYKHEFKPSDHLKLARGMSRFKKARVVLSYYDDPAVREWYKGWTFIDCMMQKNLHVQNRRGVGRCEAPEILIVNGPEYKP